MERTGAYRALVGLALVVGIVVGVAAAHSDEPKYGFVEGARPIRIAELRQGATRGTLRMYNVHNDWRALLGLVEKESPMSLSKTGTFHGLPAETVVVPQMESGRAMLFETPVREITVVQGYFVQDKSGQEIARPSDGTWSGIRVVEFRQPRILDAAEDWLSEKVRA